MNKSSVFEWHRQFVEREMFKVTQEVGSQKCKEQMQMWREYEPWCAQIED
jgi:hypothetical protein